MFRQNFHPGLNSSVDFGQVTKKINLGNISLPTSEIASNYFKKLLKNYTYRLIYFQERKSPDKTPYLLFAILTFSLPDHSIYLQSNSCRTATLRLNIFLLTRKIPANTITAPKISIFVSCSPKTGIAIIAVNTD